jgi:hypothetical protein
MLRKFLLAAILTAVVAMPAAPSITAAAQMVSRDAAIQAHIHRDALIASPSSMGAAGDSVTTAFDVDQSGALKDNPLYSWSTGSDPSVDSQYSRILAKNRAIKGHAYNVAKFGATMSGLLGQLKTLASHKVA